MLFLLVTAQRAQTLHVLKVSDIQVLTDRIVINVSSLLKQTKPGNHQHTIILQAFKHNKKLCVVETSRNTWKELNVLEMVITCLSLQLNHTNQCLNKQLLVGLGWL